MANDKKYDVPTGKQHNFRVDYWMTISFILSERREVDGEYPIYILESTDGSYFQQLSAATDLVDAGDYMQLQFKRLARGQNYKLTRFIDEAWSEVVFDDVAFETIIDQERSIHNVLENHSYGELDVDTGATIEAISWSPGADDGDNDLSDVVI